jgi:tripartite-type tricarboxylate transporter receptor subunit TctC
MKRLIAALIVLLAASAASLPAHAQSFPTKPVHVFIGQPPGTSPDIVVRLVGKEMERLLGQPLVVENRPGANSTIAAKAVVNSPPDGYALFFGSTSISPVFLKNNAVDASKELTPVSRIYESPFTVFVTAKQPFKSWPELVAYAKANPGKANFASLASLSNLLMSVLQRRADIAYTIVPYKGNVDVVKALVSGEADFTVSTPATLVSSVQAGTVRALFTTKRIAALPEVPTASEAGIPNYEVVANGTLWAPRGTPRDVVQRLSAAVASAVSAPGIAEQGRKSFGFDIVSTTPEEELRKYEAEMAFWREAARQANFEPQ